MVSIQVLATPISGLRKSASVNPMALNMERAGARSRPSVIPRLRCFKSMGKDYNKVGDPRMQLGCHPEHSEGPWFSRAGTISAAEKKNGNPRPGDARRS